ncbi:MAG: cryptochrome/photolyase family protein [Burkholderiaceae bacterium]
MSPALRPQIVWLRRDLRLTDHAAFAEALRLPNPIAAVFVFDEEILTPLKAGAPTGASGLCFDRRLAFIRASLQILHETLQSQGSGLITRVGIAREEIPALAAELGAERLVYAGDDEPDALARDTEVEARLRALDIAMVRVKDQSIFERQEVLTGAGRPFSVFTPYKNAWLKRLTPADYAERACSALQGERLYRGPEVGQAIASLASMGFDPAAQEALRLGAGPEAANTLLEEFIPRIGRYKEARDFPAVKGPSYLSVHLRFGTISIRALVRAALQASEDAPGVALGAQSWLSELIWRDFYMQILANFPKVVRRSFRPEYDRVAWRIGPVGEAFLGGRPWQQTETGPSASDDFADPAAFSRDFTAWCEGRTGYPLVDAAMRQLNQTGYMHNRLRMVVASFLTKDLEIHWVEGERYFARQLNDFDLSANNGGWQWAASTGCDAQPYFRIFNPISQSEKFDPKGEFIARYVPELSSLPARYRHAPWMAPPLVLQEAGIRIGETYPAPIVDHDAARKRTLARFSVVKAAVSP